jgi:hypothetical protein
MDVVVFLAVAVEEDVAKGVPHLAKHRISRGTPRK